NPVGNDDTPTFSFTSSESGSTFECRVDGAQFATCVSPHTTAPLGQGSHTFEVRATDAAGNTDPSPASQTFTVDTIIPNPTTSVPAPSPSNDATPTWCFTSDESGSTFQCRVDAAQFETCVSPFTSVALSEGTHTFEVRATDAAGNTDASPASQTF